MRRYLLLMLLLASPALAWAKSGTALYLCAHPDDCILFMNPNLYDDIAQDAQKVVMVYFTSGDAGLPFSQEAPKISYPYVRELAAIDATAWAADAGKRPISGDERTETVTIHGHDIDRVSYGNTASYFLRLPDGNMQGDGFELYGHESLHKLKTGEIDSITPIDGASAYKNWDDLVQVISGIIAQETTDEKKVTLHIQEPDTAKNTNDHSDHTTGANSVMEALTQRLTANADQCYLLYKHIDYAIAEKPANLDGAALQDKSGNFAVLTATQRHSLDHHDWEEGHLAYIARNYYTTATLPNGCDKPQ